MGASRAVLLPRIKPRRRYFGGGSENEDPTACTTPHPDKKTRPRSLTRAQSQSSGTRSSEAVVPSGDAGRRPGRHDRSVSEASVSTSTRTFGVGGNEGNDEGFFDRSKNASRRERLERLRVETRAAGTRAVRAAVAADHEGRVEAAARDYAVSLKHFDVYLRVEPDAALAEAVRSKAEQYRARLARIREVLTPAKATEPRDAEPPPRDAAEGIAAYGKSVDAATDRAAPRTDGAEARRAREEKHSPFCAPRQPLRAIQPAAPGRFVVTLASAAGGTERGGEATPKDKKRASPPVRGSNGVVVESVRRDDERVRGDDETSASAAKPTSLRERLSASSLDRSVRAEPAVATLERPGVTDEEADAWVEEAPATGDGDGDGDGDDAAGTSSSRNRDARARKKPVVVSRETEEKETHTGATTSVRSGAAAEEEHPPPPSTPPARPAVSPRARSRRRTYWDAEFPGLLAFAEEEEEDATSSAEEEDALLREGVETRATKEQDFFFFESAVDDAVQKFNDWFDASLRVLGDSIAETGSSYAPAVEHLFKRSVSAIDKEWRAQFPDDATYISEFSKKEYPSEARAVKRAAALPKSDEKRALAKKGARAD